MAAAGTDVEVGAVVEVRIDRMAGGGEGVGRGPDGRAVFVGGTLPGERVAVELSEVKRRHARGYLVSVDEPSPHRREPPCPHVAQGCGGCDWQHVGPATQSELRRGLVVDALTRIGRIDSPPVEAGIPLPPTATRTTLRAAVVDGRAGFRRRRSHDLVVPGSCLVAHPAAEDLLVRGRYGEADEVTVRVGARTGERMVVVGPSAAGVEVAPDVIVVGRDELERTDVALHEEVGGRRWRVSPGSFFQASAEGADALVEEVDAAVDLLVADGVATGRLVDLCAGVGLFAGTVGGRFAQVVAVEPSPSAVADARANLGREVEVVAATMARWTPGPTDVVVADPPRAGLEAAGVAAVVATGAAGVVLVSCDPGSLGRDGRLLGEAGYRLVRSRVLDLFPQTSHVEVASTFVADPGRVVDAVAPATTQT